MRVEAAATTISLLITGKSIEEDETLAATPIRTLHLCCTVKLF
jgi:hypothetical protein